MRYILNIETSASICSVTLSSNGNIVAFLEDESKNNHSTSLAPIINDIVKSNGIEYKSLAAIAVSIGPGSYTGLRIGLSMAKGLAFTLNIPLITINTLKIIASNYLLNNPNLNNSNIILKPLVDARRMEVYTADYDIDLNEINETKAIIINELFYNEYTNKQLHVFGSGAYKTKELINSNISISEKNYFSSKGMAKLTNKAYNNNDFADLAYSTPFYLKDFIAIESKKGIPIKGIKFDK